MNFTSSELSEYKEKYRDNASRAKRRGIAFRLTFEEWLGLWAEHIKERGPYRGQYVLCRKNDQGDYVIGNCYIAHGTHNSSVRGYMETRTNSIAIGNYKDQLSQQFKRQSFDGGGRPTALGRSIFLANNSMQPRAFKDAIDGLIAVYRDRYRRDDFAMCEKLVKQALYEYMNPRYYADHDRARVWQVSHAYAQRFARKMSWLLDRIRDLDRAEPKAA